MNRQDKKNKAISLVKHFMPVVYPYVGSAFLTGEEDEDFKLESSKRQARFVIEQILTAGFPYSNQSSLFSFIQNWKEIECFVDKVTLDDLM